MGANGGERTKNQKPALDSQGGIMHLRDWVQQTVNHLVDYPEKVSISVVQGTHTLHLELSVSEEDNGKVIGKKGKMVNAIRTILMAYSAKRGLRITLEVLEPTP